MKRRLLLLAFAALSGYGLGWADRAWGHTPLALMTLVAATAWLAGALWVAAPLTTATAQAQKERDDLAARLAQLEDGGTYTARPVTRLPRQDRR